MHTARSGDWLGERARDCHARAELAKTVITP